MQWWTIDGDLNDMPNMANEAKLWQSLMSNKGNAKLSQYMHYHWWLRSHIWSHHHSSDSTASHMANSAADGDTTSHGRHLLHHTRLLGLRHCRRRSSHWCGRGWGRRSSSWSRSWRSSSHGSSGGRRCCATSTRHVHSLCSKVSVSFSSYRQ